MTTLVPRDEAAAIGWPPDHLRLIPSPDPGDSAAYLRVLILNATDEFGPEHAIGTDLKAKFNVAMLQAIKQKPLAAKDL